MERYNSATPLMSKVEEESCSEAFLINDDASSGYDSTDTSDSESVSSQESRQSTTDRTSFCADTMEVLKVRSTHALSEDLKLILSLPEICDVTFLVGPTETQVHGVRAILAMRSRVFYQLILKHIQQATLKRKSSPKQRVGVCRFSSERILIPVRKYDPEVFRMLIEFVHSGVVIISMETVAGLLCGAEQFHLDDLSSACWEFVERGLASGHADALLEATRKYNHHKTAQKIFYKIYSFLDQRIQDKTLKRSADSKI